MNVQTVFGFFYRIGSSDYPVNYNPNLPFGFDEGNNNAPVFNYSINDVENAFIECRTLVRNAFWQFRVNNDNEIGAGNSSDIMIVESAGGYGNIKSDNTISTGNDWADAFKIAEFLYNNQSNVPGSPTEDGDYRNWGDQMLSSENGLFKVNGYVAHSLSFILKNISGDFQSQVRLERVYFTVRDLNGVNVNFTLYFDADAFVERSDNIKYEVYRYEDLDTPVDQISPVEMREQVFGKIFDLIKTGKYKSFRDVFIDKRISDNDDFVNEQFFVVSMINKEIEYDIARMAVKEYLIRNYQLGYLRYTYPSLFGENEIRLIPIYDNFSSIIIGSSSDSSATGNSLNPIYPLSLDTLSRELSAFGYNISSGDHNYKSAEVFYIGPGSDWTPSLGSSFRYLVPIIAVEIDSTSGITLPISARLPDFRPVYGVKESGKANEFHYILVSLFRYLLGESNNTLANEFREEYDVVIYEAGSSDGINSSDNVVQNSSIANTGVINRKRISFIFDEYLWLIYGPGPNTVPSS